MSDALLYTIKGRSRPHVLDSAKLGHFSLGEEQTVSSQLVIDEPFWIPYCIDHKQEQMIFVDVSLDVDISTAMFAHLDQFHHARRAMVVPFEVLPELAEQIPPPEEMIFVLNLPRSGSTLASRMFNQIDHVWSLSEPDIYTDIYLLRFETSNDDIISYLIEHGTRLLFRPHAEPRPIVFVIKPRGEVTALANRFHQVFPDARYLFLYRDALNFGESFYRLIQRAIDAPPFLDKSLVVDVWRQLTDQRDMQLLEQLLDLDQGSIPNEEFIAAIYCAKIEQYLTTFDRGVPYCAVRYNEWNSNREVETSRILEHCGLPLSALPHAMLAFESDSQAGSQIARDVTANPFSDEQTSRYLQVLARHPRLSDPNILLPDIYHPERVI